MTLPFQEWSTVRMVSASGTTIPQYSKSHGSVGRMDEPRDSVFVLLGSDGTRVLLFVGPLVEYKEEYEKDDAAAWRARTGGESQP